MLNFNDCTLAKLDKLFALKQIRTNPTLTEWLTQEAEIVDWEVKVLQILQESAILNIHDWNEIELIQRFIGPLFELVQFTSDKFNLFAERPFEGVVKDVKLGGKPDGMIASGWREPEKPYFCFQEYKKVRDPKGDPAGQVLAAMLVAQEINDYQHPVYGCYIDDRNWYFMILQNDTYCISKAYIATDENLFDIFRILKALKYRITELVAQSTPD